MNTIKITEDAIFKIGRVIAVDGRTIRVKVDKTKNTSHLLYKGDLLKNVSVGGYIKIIKGFTKIIGKVEGEYTTEDKQFAQRGYTSDREKVNRVLSVSLLGFFRKNIFERGIKELPLIDNECFLLHNSEFNQVHNFLRNDTPLVLGTLSLERGQEIAVGVNSLFASHIGIFGNTGSGKSYTLAKIYRELFNKYKNQEKFKTRAQFVLLDFNGEYVDSVDNVIVEKEYKNIYKLSTKATPGDKFPITKKVLSEPSFWIVLLEATEKTQAPFLRRVIDNEYMLAKISTEEGLKTQIASMLVSATDKNDKTFEKNTITNFLFELKECFGINESLTALYKDYQQNLHFHSVNQKFFYGDGSSRIFSGDPAFTQTVINEKVAALSMGLSGVGFIDLIRIRIVIQYFDEIIRGFSNREHLAPLIKRMDRRISDFKKVIQPTEEIPQTNNKNLTVISLKDVNIHTRKILPMLFCKKLYDEKKEKCDENTYLNFIIDEAHNILSEDSDRESEQWKDYRLETFEEIIKEGRKFGVFLTIASQRPADISPTIISQLHNYFLHRLINNEDIRAVEKTISFLDKVSFEYLPILPTGTCIMAGLLAQVPVVIDVGRIPSKYEPKNKTITLTEKWQDI